MYMSNRIQKQKERWMQLISNCNLQHNHRLEINLYFLKKI